MAATVNWTPAASDVNVIYGTRRWINDVMCSSCEPH